MVEKIENQQTMQRSNVRVFSILIYGTWHKHYRFIFLSIVHIVRLGRMEEITFAIQTVAPKSFIFARQIQMQIDKNRC